MDVCELRYRDYHLLKSQYKLYPTNFQEQKYEYVLKRCTNENFENPLLRISVDNKRSVIFKYTIFALFGD
jgi:hypothetical protein